MYKRFPKYFLTVIAIYVVFFFVSLWFLSTAIGAGVFDDSVFYIALWGFLPIPLLYYYYKESDSLLLRILISVIVISHAIFMGYFVVPIL